MPEATGAKIVRIHGKPASSEDAPPGATMRPKYMVREMTMYPVHEYELEIISYLNTQSTVLFSIGSVLITLAASIWANAIFYTSLTAAGQLATKYVAPGMFVIALSFIGLGVHAVYIRAGRWQKIRQESYSSQAAVPTGTSLVEAPSTKHTEAVALSVAIANGTDRLEQTRKARLKGYTGDACGECGNFTLVRNGTCLKCMSCGATSGCS